MQRRRLSLNLVLQCWVWLLLSHTFFAAESVAAPSLSTPITATESVPVGQPTPVTIQIQVVTSPTDPPLIDKGLNLLRLDAQGKATVLGVMHDDGRDGDAIAGDKIYTLTITFTESDVGKIRLQGSAAFKGRLKRVLSDIKEIPVIPAEPSNHPPTANAGPDQTKAVASIVHLDGSGSTDQDGQLLSFAWSFVTRPSGSTAELDAPTSVKPSFIIDRAGSYRLQLVVNDGETNSTADIVEISTENSKPVANAGLDQTVAVGLPALLDGSVSNDVDQDALRYRWSFVAVPEGSTPVLQGDSTPQPSFMVSKAGTYIVRLIVNDGQRDSDPATVTIRTDNSTPVANAGQDVTVFIGDTVQLDGTQSRDADSDPLTSRWSFTFVPTDSRATLSNPTIAKPTFVPDKLGLYVIQLIVNDGKKDSAPDTASIRVNVEAPPNQRPNADAGQQQSGTVGQPIQLDGSKSNDPDENPITYIWTFAVKPGTSTAQLDDPKSATPKFTPDVSGTYTLQLIVNDGLLDSLPSLVTITVSDVGVNNPPTAHAGADQTVTVDTTVQLTGVTSDDLDNDPLTYQWTLTGKPNGSTAQLLNATTATPSFTADVAGEYTAQLIVNDGKVNSAPDTVKITVEAELPLAIAITTPTNNFLTNLTTVPVTGTVDSRAQTATVDGIAATRTGTAFSVTVPVKEGNNTVTAIARTSAGKVGTANVTIVRDSTPPNVVIESPVAAQIITEPQVTIVGMVNDIVTGTVNQENCTVEIRGPAGTRTATVQNRTFLVPDFPLVLAVNSLNAIATDTAGNPSAPFQIQVIRQAPQGPQLLIISGNDQTGIIGATLPTPLIVKASEENGTPIAGKAVLFQVVRNNGLLQAPGIQEDKSEVTVVTDANGQASVSWTLGTRAGTGNNRVEVSAPGIVVPVLFNASATPMPCDRLLTMNGENQVGAVDKALARPFEVVAVDPGGNVCAGISVTFRVESGGGNFASLPAEVKKTNSDGRASAILTLGPTAGVNNNVVAASFTGVGDFGARFRASAVAPGPESATRFVGVVLDTEDRPIPQVEVKIENTNPLIESLTDEKGQFVLTGVPTGSGLLLVRGDTTPRAGVWPPLEFHIDVIAGIDNTLGMPIYLPELNSSGFRSVGTEDTILEMPGIEGFKLKIFANSATFPSGSKTGMMGVTQVSNDQVPMPPPGGLAPAWVLTLQPPGVRLNPPAQLTMPNAYGLPPGQIIDIFSFDHDLQQFVSVGTATVQPDGAMIVSDPGSGIRKSGWGHGPPPPPPPGTAGGCAGPGPCQPPPSCQGQSCNDFNPCNGLEFCNPQSGVCQPGIPLSDEISCTTPCVSGGTCQNGSCTGGTPITPTDDPNDCRDLICQNGSLISQPDNSEIPLNPNPDPNDCKQLRCEGGQPVLKPDDLETPVDFDLDPQDCRKNVCLNGNRTPFNDNNEICSDGNPATIDDHCENSTCGGGTNPSCNFVPFDPATQGCCDGVIFDRTTQGCCYAPAFPGLFSGTVYNPALECCGPSRVVDKSDLSDLSQCPNRQGQRPPRSNECGGEGGQGFPNNPVLPLGCIDVSFGPACNDHDECYDVCGSSKIVCDAQYLIRLQTIYTTTFSSLSPICLAACLESALVYAGAVITGGGPFYEAGQRYGCVSCCP